MTRKSNKVPATIRAIKEKIESGEYSGILPTRLQLTKELGESNETINKAIMNLQAQGIIIAIPGRKYIMVNTQTLRLPGVVDAFDRYLEREGKTPFMRNLEDPHEVELDADLAKWFNLPAGTKAIRRARLQGEQQDSRQVPMRIAETYYLRELVDDNMLEAMINTPRFTVIDAIKQKTGKYMNRIHSDVINRLPDEREAQLLEITIDTPIYEHYRTCYAQDGTITMFNRIILTSFRFVMSFDHSI